MGRITLSGEVENHLPRQCAQHVAERLILMAGSGIRKLNAVTSSEPLSFANLVWKNAIPPTNCVAECTIREIKSAITP